MWWYEGEDRDVFFDNKTSVGNSAVPSSPNTSNKSDSPASSSSPGLSAHASPELRSYIGDTQDPPFHPSRSPNGTATTRRSSTAMKNSDVDEYPKDPLDERPCVDREEPKPSLFVAITRLLFRSTSKRKPSRDRGRARSVQVPPQMNGTDMPGSGRGRGRDQVSGTNSGGSGIGISIPDLSRIHYVWQIGENNKKEQMLQRQAELRQLDLAQDENLLIEWFALIQQLDCVVRQEALSKGYRPRSHSLPPQPSHNSEHDVPATNRDQSAPDSSEPTRAGSGDNRRRHNRSDYASNKAENSSSRRPRSNTIEGAPGGTWQPTNTSKNLPRFTANKTDPAVLSTMREKLRAKEEELSRVRAELRRAVNEQHMDDVHKQWKANDPLKSSNKHTETRNGHEHSPLQHGAPRAKHAIPMTPYRMRSVTVTRDENGSFGIQVKPTKGKAYGVVRISGVKDTRRAHGLQVGDVLFEVDGHYLLTSSYDNVVAIIRNAGDFATFVVASASDVDAIHGGEFNGQDHAASPTIAHQADKLAATPTVHCTPPHTPPHTPRGAQECRAEQHRQRSAMHCPQTPHTGGEADGDHGHTVPPRAPSSAHSGGRSKQRSGSRSRSRDRAGVGRVRMHREFTIRPKSSTSDTSPHASQ